MDEYDLEELGSNYDFVSDESGEDPIFFNPDTGGDTDVDTGYDFTGGESQDQDLTSAEALLGQGYTQDELGNYYKVGSGGQYSFVGSDGKVYNLDTARGGFMDAAGRLANSAISKTLGNSVKNLIYKKGADGKLTDELDFAKLLTLGGGAYAATQSNNRTQPAGYQGKIPTYTATRQAPGIGQLLSGDVLYKKPDGTVVNPNSAAPSTGIAPPVQPAEPAKSEPVQGMARGGSLEPGGFVIPADVVSHLGNGSSSAGLRLLAEKMGARPIKGKGDGMSDSIPTTIGGRQPARVANEEAHLSKAQVDALGGAKKLYAMMDKIRQARTGSKEQGKQINPGKFMPGGSVGYAAGGVPSFAGTTGSTVPAGTTGTESNLSNWAGDYVTNMLGKGQALSEMPYEQYKGPLTAGASNLQTKVSQGLEGITFPSNLGQSFSSSTAPTIGADGQPTGGGGIASNYMNPYLSNVLNPQLAEMRRQAEINNLSSLGGLTKSGAFGGGRQAIMESEANRNLLTEQNKTIGQGYANAYDKAMQQFNTEQGQAKDLTGIMASQGAVDRGITGEGIAADKAQFEEARLNPYKMVQFQQSLLSGLPLAAQTYNQAPTDNLTQFSNAATTIDKLLKNLGQTGT